MHRVSLSPTLLLLSVVTANADALTLSQLHELCHSTEVRDSAACAGFMSGFVQGIQQGQQAAAEGKTICFPDGFKIAQMNLILDKIIRDGPQFTNLEAIPGLVIPLQISFPCNKHSK
jgi:hypothetical protein